jgi:hypothetical protein
MGFGMITDADRGPRFRDHASALGARQNVQLRKLLGRRVKLVTQIEAVPAADGLLGDDKNQRAD